MKWGQRASFHQLHGNSQPAWLHTGMESNDLFGFWFLFIFLLFLELLPKTLKIVKDAAVRLAQCFVSNAHLSS